MNYSQLNFTKLKVANYNRKSSESEDKQMLSIISQLEEAQRIKEYYNLPKFIEVFEEAKSAKTENNRPKFTEMIEMIRNGKIDTILCWKLDRLARNMTEGGMIIDLLSSGVIKAIITHDKVYYPSDNVLLMSVEFGQSNQFIKDLSVNVKRGQTKKAEMGLPHGVATLGFLNDKSEEKGNRKWVVDNERFWKIQKLFEMFLTGNYSAGKLYEYAVRELKLTTVKRKRSGGELIQLSRIYEILKDPVCAGFFFYNNERYTLDTSLPRMITEAQHEKVLKLLSRKNIPKTQRHKVLYAGYIVSDKNEYIGPDVKFQMICDCKNKFAYINKTHCPKCGLDIDKTKNPKYLSYTNYYNVKLKKSKRLNPLVKTKSVKEEEITNFIKNEVLKKITFSEDWVKWCKENIHQLKDKKINENIKIIQDKEKRELEYKEKRAKIRDKYNDDKITEKEYREDIERLDEKYSDLKNTNKPEIDWMKEISKIINLSEEGLNIIENDTYEAKRNLLSLLGSHLIWNEKKLSIINKKAIDKYIYGLDLMKSEYPKFAPNLSFAEQGLKEKTDEFSPIFSTMLRG